MARARYVCPSVHMGNPILSAALGSPQQPNLTPDRVRDYFQYWVRVLLTPELYMNIIGWASNERFVVGESSSFSNRSSFNLGDPRRPPACPLHSQFYKLSGTQWGPYAAPSEVPFTLPIY